MSLFTDSLATGAIVDGHYRIEEPLGQGSFSQVYLTRFHGQNVALKLLNRGQPLADEAEAIADFKNEFAILKELHHPHIAGILDFGFDPDKQQFYFTSEYVAGVNLYAATEHTSPLEALELFVQALRAFNYLHSYRIFHLDVKAANLLVTQQAPRQVKLIDFGLASMSPGEQLVGTPSYMAPEIIRHQRPDGRADIYSLGVLFYYCLTRKNPFRDKGIQATFRKHLSFTPELPSSFNKEIPSFLDRILLRMLEKNRGDRYQSADEILRDISAHSPDKIPLETRETLLSYLPDEGRFIGRIKEKRLFREQRRQLFERKTRKHGLILVSGDRGTGKTRFLKEMRYECELSGIPGWQPEENSVATLLHWCEQVREEALNDKRPLALFIDDINQLCELSEIQRTLSALLLRLKSDTRREHGILIIAACDTPDELSETISEILSEPDAIPIQLKAFTRREVAAYVTSLTGVEDPPDTFLDELWNRTEGNVLLVTEVLRSLIETGALFDENGRWQASVFEDIGVDFSDVQISEALSELLLARAKRASTEGQKILKWLACTQEPLTVSQLQKLVDKKDISTSLEDLRRHNLIERETEHGTYHIQNTSIAEILYAQITEKERSQLHDRLATLYEENSGVRAYHELRGSNLELAISTASQWGNAHLEKAESIQAISIFRHILSRIPKTAKRERIEYLLKLSEASLLALDYAAAEAACDEVSESLKKLKKTEALQEQLDTIIRIGALSLKLGNTEKAQASFDKAQSLITSSEAPLTKQLNLKNFQARVLLQEGNYEEAIKIFRETYLQWKNELSDDEKRRVTNNDLGMAFFSLREYEKALGQFEEDLLFYEKIEDNLLIARGHYNIAEACLVLEEYDQAISHYKNAARYAQQIKNSELLLRAYNGLGNVYHITENAEESTAYYERGLALCERIGDLIGQTALLVNLGTLYSQQQEFAKARMRLELAVSLLRNRPLKSAFEWHSLCRALLELGDMARRQQEWQASLNYLNECHELAKNHVESLKFWALHALTELHLDQNRYLDAEETYSALSSLSLSPDEERKANQLKMKIMQPEPTPQPREPNMSNPYASILKINQFINAESDLDFVLKTVLQYALEFSSAESGLILLHSEDGKLEIKASLNLKNSEDIAEFSRTIAERAMSTGQWITTQDAKVDERFSEESSITGLDIKAVLCLPIRSKQQTIGALYLENRLQKGAFDESNMEVMSAFADQAGIAIANAKTLSQVKASHSNLEAQIVEMSGKLEHYQALLPELQSLSHYEVDGIIGRSKAMKELFSLMDKIADTDLAVYIHGESGTGKELIARALHRHSTRSNKSFVAVNCGAIPENLMESELFGVKAGAFTGASRDKKGLVEEAHGGTLFLDEIAELDLMLQVKLLRLLQEGEFRRVGDTKVLQADIRIVSASNQDLEELVRQEQFREDLFYRLCQIRLDLPALRDRPEDIPLLIDHFISLEKGDKKVRVVSALMKTLIEYPWPGNIRELENLIKVTIALSEKGVIDTTAIPRTHPLSRFMQNPASDVRPAGTTSVAPSPTSTVRIDTHNHYDSQLQWADYERVIIAKALAEHNYQIKATATSLGLAATTMYKKVKEWDLNDKNNPLFSSPFVYSKGKKIADYIPEIFQAALKTCNDKPYQAIEQLGVSPGYFYKMIKRAK